MTTEQHPITPPPELRRLWAQQAQRMDPWDSIAWLQHVSTQAAHWGADQELDECCEWLSKYRQPILAADLRFVRRPKPPSLAEQALAELDQIPTHDNEGRTVGGDVSIIRAALERLQELESDG